MCEFSRLLFREKEYAHLIIGKLSAAGQRENGGDQSLRGRKLPFASFHFPAGSSRHQAGLNVAVDMPVVSGDELQDVLAFLTERDGAVSLKRARAREAEFDLHEC
jgi:hypothetical protein